MTARLCLRQRKKDGLNIWFALDGDGQFMCTSYDGCRVSVRFGDDPAQKFSAAEGSDNSSNLIFITGESKMLAGIKRSSKVLIEAEFYEAGEQTAHFNTAGLVWPPKS